MSTRTLLQLAFALMFALAITGCGSSEGSAGAAEELAPTEQATTSTTIAVDPAVASTRAWRTLIATTLSDPLTIADPVEGPDGRWTAISARGGTVRVWTFEQGTWVVSETVQLVDQAVLDDEPLPGGNGEQHISVDGTGSDVRFLVPTAYGNGPAVAAIGHDAPSWRLLSFTGVYGEQPFAMDAELDGGTIVVWFNDCQPSCADGHVTPVTPVRTPGGYDIPAPPPPPEPPRPSFGPGDPCEPGSSPDCVDQWDDGDYRIIVGVAECLDLMGYDRSWLQECSDLDGDGFAGYPDSN